jgi:hypothetical protein
MPGMRIKGGEGKYGGDDGYITQLGDGISDTKDGTTQDYKLMDDGNGNTIVVLITPPDTTDTQASTTSVALIDLPKPPPTLADLLPPPVIARHDPLDYGEFLASGPPHLATPPPQPRLTPLQKASLAEYLDLAVLAGVTLCAFAVFLKHHR